MSANHPVAVPEWQQFLRDYSDEYLRTATDEDLACVDARQRENRWMGYEAATEEAVLATEERLGVRLPPSYRNFLLVSNGWRDVDPEIGELLGVDEVQWFAERDADLLEAWADAELHEIIEVVKPCLVVSDHSGCAVHWLLDPTKIGPGGEATAYEWATGDGSDPEPFPHFSALVTRGRAANAHRAATGATVKSGPEEPAAPADARTADARANGNTSATRIDRLDNLVLDVADLDATIDFYTRVLDVDVVAHEDRTALAFGDTRIDLRVAGLDAERSGAAHPAPGTTELGFVVEEPVLLLIDKLQDRGVRIEAGPVSRTGARGTLHSLHLRDPDGNLIKLGNYLD
ncbi:VOC family protein [Saccharopolyspora sp. CA-218241]|uniref:VOC family protein n=1 Tax=Saccharopolyspora sp. CA-218241 TaxID=3240027 RepID=UPI003D9765E3